MIERNCWLLGAIMMLTINSDFWCNHFLHWLMETAEREQLFICLFGRWRVTSKFRKAQPWWMFINVSNHLRGFLYASKFCLFATVAICIANVMGNERFEQVESLKVFQVDHRFCSLPHCNGQCLQWEGSFGERSEGNFLKEKEE